MFTKRLIQSIAGKLKPRLIFVLIIGALLVAVASPAVFAHSVVSTELANSVIHLPMVIRNFPPVPNAPVLDAISNADGDGNYPVSWSVPAGATTYMLQEDDNAAFSSPTVAYTGAGTSITISGRDIGTYYYRVRGENMYTSSAWSNIASVTVTVPMPDCPQSGTWLGITSQASLKPGRPITFGIENSPQCQITANSLQIEFRDSVCAIERVVVFQSSIPIVDEHFYVDGGSTQVEGFFSSRSSASGTFNYVNGSCNASGAWAIGEGGANDYVWELAKQADGRILVGGDFTEMDGVLRNHIARLNADGTLDTAFNPDANGLVRVLAVQTDGKIVVGGDFTVMGGQTRNRIARLNLDGSLDTTFNPGASLNVNTLAVQKDGRILVAGSFTTLGGEIRNRIARLNADGSLDATFNPGANNQVTKLIVQEDGRIVVGGYFTLLGGETRNRIARLNADGSLDATFNPGANDFVYDLVIQPDGRILAAGYFTEMGAMARNRIARLNADGSLDMTFNPNAGSTVNAMALQTDGRILMGGEFSSVVGVARSYIARLNPDGTLDTTFNPGACRLVRALEYQEDGRILAGGYFIVLGGGPRFYIARLNSNGTLDDPIP